MLNDCSWTDQVNFRRVCQWVLSFVNSAIHSHFVANSVALQQNLMISSCKYVNDKLEKSSFIEVRFENNLPEVSPGEINVSCPQVADLVKLSLVIYTFSFFFPTLVKRIHFSC